jgi:hypothetical protein
MALTTYDCSEAIAEGSRHTGGCKYFFGTRSPRRLKFPEYILCPMPRIGDGFQQSEAKYARSTWLLSRPKPACAL